MSSLKTRMISQAMAILAASQPKEQSIVEVIEIKAKPKCNDPTYALQKFEPRKPYGKKARRAERRRP